MATPAMWRLYGVPVGAAASLGGAAVLQYANVASIGWVLALAIYFVVWWTLLFAILPIGARTQSDAGAMIKGTSAGAPLNPRLGRVAGLTTIAASVAFAIVLIVIRARIITFE